MKLLRILAVTGISLVTLSGLQANESSGAASPAAQWVAHYYQNPQPADFLPAVHRLSASGYFESPGQPATAIGFFSVIFAQNPQRVNGWLAQTSALPESHRRILAVAAWGSGHPAGARLMAQMSAQDSPELRREISRMLDRGTEPVAATPVLSASSMNLQWGAFLASGDDRHIVNVLAALGSGEPGLVDSARSALAQNAITHPRVLEICHEQLERQPAAIRSEIRAALNDAAAKPGA